MNLIKTTIEDINQRQKGTISEFLGIEITEIGQDFLAGKMPVNEKTIQPAGILHGGASVVLAETLGSIAANFSVDMQKYICVGLEVNANHLRSVPTGGWVYGKATAIHLGRTTQIWDIRLTNQEGQLTCISRLTIAVLERKNKNF
jgi:1,4-dihydroxy-2-naphthoyl-CoA hydrolase